MRVYAVCKPNYVFSPWQIRKDSNSASFNVYIVQPSSKNLQTTSYKPVYADAQTALSPRCSHMCKTSFIMRLSVCHLDSNPRQNYEGCSESNANEVIS